MRTSIRSLTQLSWTQEETGEGFEVWDKVDKLGRSVSYCPGSAAVRGREVTKNTRQNLISP